MKRGGSSMKHMSIILAVLLVAGSLTVLPLYVDEGGEDAGSSEPPAVENKTVILADEGGDSPPHGEPSPEEARNAVLV
jgi:hypothetical protein